MSSKEWLCVHCGRFIVDDAVPCSSNGGMAHAACETCRTCDCGDTDPLAACEWVDVDCCQEVERFACETVWILDGNGDRDVRVCRAPFGCADPEEMIFVPSEQDVQDYIALIEAEERDSDDHR